MGIKKKKIETPGIKVVIQLMYEIKHHILSFLLKDIWIK